MEIDSLKEYENSMTIYYMKTDGVIIESQTGINNMTTFGVHELNYSLIYDFIVVEKEAFFLENRRYFKVDIETKELVYYAPILKYKTK